MSCSPAGVARICNSEDLQQGARDRGGIFLARWPRGFPPMADFALSYTRSTWIFRRVAHARAAIGLLALGNHASRCLSPGQE